MWLVRTSERIWSNSLCLQMRKLRLWVGGSLLLLFFRGLVVSDSLRPHGLKHAKLLCLHYLPPRVCPSLCPLSRRCHPTISSSVTPFSSCRQSFPASGSFQMSSCSYYCYSGRSNYTTRVGPEVSTVSGAVLLGSNRGLQARALWPTAPTSSLPLPQGQPSPL